MWTPVRKHEYLAAPLLRLQRGAAAPPGAQGARRIKEGFHSNWDLGSQEILPLLRTLTNEAERT